MNRTITKCIACIVAVAATGCTRAVTVPRVSYDIVEPEPGTMYELETDDGREFITTALNRSDSAFVIHNHRGDTAQPLLSGFHAIDPVTVPLDAVVTLRRYESGAAYRKGDLAVGDRVRITGDDGRLTIGRVLSFDTTAIRIETDAAEMASVPPQRVARIERYNPEHPKVGSNAVAGMSIGLGTGVFLAWADGGPLAGLAVVGGIVIGTAIGAAAGIADDRDPWQPVSLRRAGIAEPPHRGVFGES